MIEEDYVSFEIAKLLKEKGFDEKVISFYPPGDIQRPTLQMAMKWLREVHKIFIEIKEYFDIKQYQSFVSKYGKTTYCEPDWFHPICNSYEEACEDAIKYCLENLI